MDEILKKRIEEAAINGSKHYDPNISKYSQDKQVGNYRDASLDVKRID